MVDLSQILLPFDLTTTHYPYANQKLLGNLNNNTLGK